MTAHPELGALKAEFLPVNEADRGRCSRKLVEIADRAYALGSSDLARAQGRIRELERTVREMKNYAADMGVDLSEFAP